MMHGADVFPLNPERWDDFERLFGVRGAVGGCWCMWWRLKAKTFAQQKGEANRLAMRALVESGPPPGILMYHHGEPVGWCSLGPRQAFGRLERSRVLKRVDEQDVWSVVCFFVAKAHRRQGVMTALLRAAMAYAHQQGARILEGYPVEPKQGVTPDVFAYTGLASVYRQLGFVEVARRSPTRPIFRYIFPSEE